MAPDSSWPSSDEDRVQARREGVRRLVRGSVKGVVILGLFALSTALPAMHDNLWLSTYWLLWCTYLVFSGAIDFACVSYLLAGIRLTETFNMPPLARSPRDFWSRRWNLWFRTFSHRNIFVPMGGKERAVLSAVLIFVVSAVIHEYIVLTSLGYTRGHMTAFFLLQGAATIGTTLLARKLGKRRLMPRIPAVALHMVWLTLTAHLFFAPLLELLPLTEWRLW